MLLFHSFTEVDTPDSSVIFDISPLDPNHQKLMLTVESRLEFSRAMHISVGEVVPEYRIA